MISRGVFIFHVIKSSGDKNLRGGVGKTLLLQIKIQLQMDSWTGMFGCFHSAI